MKILTAVAILLCVTLLAAGPPCPTPVPSPNAVLNINTNAVTNEVCMAFNVHPYDGVFKLKVLTMTWPMSANHLYVMRRYWGLGTNEYKVAKVFWQADTNVTQVGSFDAFMLADFAVYKLFRN